MPKRLPPRLVRRRKRMLGGAFFLLAVGAAGWVIFLTSAFTVQKIHLIAHGRNTIPRERVEGIVEELKSKRPNILVLSPRTWERRLVEAFPELRQVTVRRTVLRLTFLSNQPGFINEVSVFVHEREPAGTVCRGLEPVLNCFIFDRDGVIFSPAASSTPYVLDKRNVEYRLRYRVLNPEIASRLAETVSRTVIGLPAVRLELTDAETNFITLEGWGLILSNERSFGEQFEAARIVLEREIGPRRAELEYIDTTIKNRVYYRYRNK